MMCGCGIEVPFTSVLKHLKYLLVTVDMWEFDHHQSQQLVFKVLVHLLCGGGQCRPTVRTSWRQQLPRNGSGTCWVPWHFGTAAPTHTSLFWSTHVHWHSCKDGLFKSFLLQAKHTASTSSSASGCVWEASREHCLMWMDFTILDLELHLIFFFPTSF